MDSDFCFSSKLQERPVNIDGAQYTLRQADEGVNCQYKNALLKRVKLDGMKIVSTDGLAEQRSFLVGLCLYNSNGQPVGHEFVKTLPPAAVSVMFDWVEKVSNLKEAVEEGKG